MFVREVRSSVRRTQRARSHPPLARPTRGGALHTRTRRMQEAPVASWSRTRARCLVRPSHPPPRSCKVSLFLTRACPGPPDTSMAPSKRLYWSHVHIRAYMHRPDGHSTRQVRPIQPNGPLSALSGMHGPDTFLHRVPHPDPARQRAAHPHARAEEKMPKEPLIVVMLEELGAQSLPRGRHRSAHETACSERACECGRARVRAYPPDSEA